VHALFWGIRYGGRGRGAYHAQYAGMLLFRYMSTPTCRMAFGQAYSPSIPTHADTACRTLLLAPGGSFTLGTLMVPAMVR
jgi:hypothetical protein